MVSISALAAIFYLGAMWQRVGQIAGDLGILKTDVKELKEAQTREQIEQVSFRAEMRGAIESLRAHRTTTP